MRAIGTALLVLGVRAGSMNHRGDHRAPDAPLLRRTRWRLALISAAATLATLLVLGAALYLAVNATLSGAAVSALRQQAAGPQVEAGPRGPGERPLALLPPGVAPHPLLLALNPSVPATSISQAAGSQ